MKIDARAIEPFNEWWRKITREGDPLRRPNVITEAFAAGFRAGMEHAVEAACEIIKAHPESRG